MKTISPLYSFYLIQLLNKYNMWKTDYRPILIYMKVLINILVMIKQ